MTFFTRAREIIPLTIFQHIAPVVSKRVRSNTQFNTHSIPLLREVRLYTCFCAYYVLFSAVGCVVAFDVGFLQYWESVFVTTHFYSISKIILLFSSNRVEIGSTMLGCFSQRNLNYSMLWWGNANRKLFIFHLHTSLDWFSSFYIIMQLSWSYTIYIFQ